MHKSLANDAYVKCDILTGRIYRCLTGLFQDYIDIRFTELFGNRWIEKVLDLSVELVKNEKNKALISLLKKRENTGIEIMDKSSLDVTLANNLMLYSCFYVLAVPKYQMPERDLRSALSNAPGQTVSSFSGYSYEQLQIYADEQIRNNITFLCNLQIPKNSIGDHTFFKLVKKLVDNKNALNSHMSEVHDPSHADQKIAEMIVNLKDFLAYLDAQWESPLKTQLILEYRQQISEVEYLRYSNEFGSVVSAINVLIQKMPKETPTSTSYSSTNTCSANYIQAFRQLSDKKTHIQAFNTFTAESDSLSNPCATIMLAFMYEAGWAKGQVADDVLLMATMLSDPNEWLTLAENNQLTSREQAAAFYIGYAMIKKDPSYFEPAGYLGVRLLNYELTKECFRRAGSVNSNAKQFYQAFASLPNEEAFIRKAISLNKR